MIPITNINLNEEEAKAAYDVVKSGWVSMGKKVKEFENNFKKYVNAKNTIAVNNGTAALHACLVAVGVEPGDEVIVPSLTFISTANVVLYEKAKPVLVECDPKTYNVTAEEIEKNITKKTKAIIPVDMNGMPIDYDSILELAEKHSLPVILDSAESLGAEYKNKKVGGIAPIHCFSFYPNKNATTGEGGMITTNDSELAEKIRMIRTHGQDRRYHHVILGYNYRLTDIQAAIGIVQMKRLEWVLKKKENLAKIYNEVFENTKNIETPFVPAYVTRHAWYMYAICLKNGNRDELVKKLQENGIEIRLSFPPIHTQPVYQKMFGFNDMSLPLTFNTWNKLINIPIWAGMGKEKQDYIISMIKKFCK